MIKGEVVEVGKCYFLLEMFPNIIKLGPVCAAERDLVSYQAPLPEVEVDEGDDPEALVRLGSLLASPAGDVFARAEYNRIHGQQCQCQPVLDTVRGRAGVMVGVATLTTGDKLTDRIVNLRVSPVTTPHHSYEIC